MYNYTFAIDSEKYREIRTKKSANGSAVLARNADKDIRTRKQNVYFATLKLFVFLKFSCSIEARYPSARLNGMMLSKHTSSSTSVSCVEIERDMKFLHDCVDECKSEYGVVQSHTVTFELSGF